MSKIKFELDLSDLFTDYGYDSDGVPKGECFNDWVQNEIDSQIRNTISERIDSAVKNQIDFIIKEQYDDFEIKIANKFNEMMDDFFDTPYTLKDKWGATTRENVTVKQLLREGCDNFINEKVDNDGKPYSYGNKTRLEYLINKHCQTYINNTSYSLEQTVKKATEEMKTRILGVVQKELGAKLYDFVGLENIINKNNT